KVATANPQAISDLFIARELKAQALDDQTLEIKLAFPDPYFTTLTSLPEFRPVPHDAVTKDPDWTKPATILTDGPWVLADSSQDTQPAMTLVRNSIWPNSADTSTEGNVERLEISFSPLSDPASTAVKQLLAGTADFAPLDFTGVGLLQSAKPDLIQTAPG